MEEKRKLEKLLLSDIDGAVAAYELKREKASDALEDAILAKPPKKATALLARHIAMEKQAKEAVRELEELGFDTSWDSGRKVLGIKRYGIRPEQMRDFDAETARVKKSLADAKRTYTMKLFAEGAEAQTLFASLAKELDSIVR